MNWNIDIAHSHVDFAVRHLGISTVRGRFRTFGGSASTNASGDLEQITANIDPASLDTGVEQRDAHLRSADFFDVAVHPAMTFASTRVTPLGARRYRAEGDLSMHGVSKPVVLDVELGEPIKDPWGNTRVAALATGQIKRSEWGLVWNQVLELGGFAVSDDVKISLEVEASQAATVAAAA